MLGRIMEQDAIELFQPYHGPAGRPDNYSGPYVHQLTLLRELSNADKHRALTEVILDPNHFQYRPGPGATVLDLHLRAWTESALRGEKPHFEPPEMCLGHVVARAAVPGLGLKGPTFVGFAIPSVALEKRRPAVPTLRRITKYVELILEAFE